MRKVAFGAVRVVWKQQSKGEGGSPGLRRRVGVVRRAGTCGNWQLRKEESLGRGKKNVSVVPVVFSGVEGSGLADLRVVGKRHWCGLWGSVHWWQGGGSVPGSLGERVRLWYGGMGSRGHQGRKKGGRCRESGQGFVGCG